VSILLKFTFGIYLIMNGEIMYRPTFDHTDKVKSNILFETWQMARNEGSYRSGASTVNSRLSSNWLSLPITWKSMLGRCFRQTKNPREKISSSDNYLRVDVIIMFWPSHFSFLIAIPLVDIAVVGIDAFDRRQQLLNSFFACLFRHNELVMRQKCM
jgi:hypothetical protein